MKITRRQIRYLIESYISVPGKGLAPLHDTQARRSMGSEALAIAKDILKKHGLDNQASRLDDTSDKNIETIRQIYDAVKGIDVEGRLTPVHDQAFEALYDIHQSPKDQRFVSDPGTKPVRRHSFSQFKNKFGKYNPAGVVDINTGKKVPSISIAVSYKTYNHMNPNHKESIEEVVSSIDIPAHVVTNAYGHYLLWSKKADSANYKLGDIHNEHASNFILLADKLEEYLEEYTIAFVKDNYPNQNMTVFQISPANTKLRDVIRRAADLDNLP